MSVIHFTPEELAEAILAVQDFDAVRRLTVKLSSGVRDDRDIVRVVVDHFEDWIRVAVAYSVANVAAYSRTYEDRHGSSEAWTFGDVRDALVALVRDGHRIPWRSIRERGTGTIGLLRYNTISNGGWDACREHPEAALACADLATAALNIATRSAA